MSAETTGVRGAPNGVAANTASQDLRLAGRPVKARVTTAMHDLTQARREASERFFAAGVPVDAWVLVAREQGLLDMDVYLGEAAPAGVQEPAR